MSRPSLPRCICYLNPGPSVVLGSRPGVHQTLLVETGEVGVPLLQAEESAVGGGGSDLLVGDYAAFHAKRTGTFWVKKIQRQAHLKTWQVKSIQG